MRRPMVSICACLCLFIAVTGFFTGPGKSGFAEFEGRSTVLEGFVRDVTEKDDDAYSFVLDTQRGRVMVNVYGDGNVKPRKLLYRDIAVRGEIALPEGRSNPGCFDYRRCLAARKIYTLMKAKGIERDLGYHSRFHEAVSRIRDHTMSFFERKLDEDLFGFISGILFGASEYMDEDDLETARRGGTAHILAVSGMHMGIIYGFLCRFRRRKRNRGTDAAILGVMLVYAMMAGMSPSVVRALMIITVHIFSKYVHERFDMISGLCACICVLLICSPGQIFDTGFQMTFIAAFSIALALPYMQERNMGILAPVTAIQTGMMPYQAYVFNYISLTSFFANIPIAFLSGIIVPLGFISIPLSYIPFIGDLTAKLLGISLACLKTCNEFTYMKGMLTFDIVTPPVIIIALWYTAMLLFLSDKGRIWRIRRETEKIWAVILLVCVLSLPAGMIIDDGYRHMDAVFVDVGQGDCIHIRSGGRDYLIDGGGSIDYDVGTKIVKPYLLKNGTRHIDAAFVTHMHTDHYKAVCELAADGMVKRLYVYEANKCKEDEICKDTGLKREDISYLRGGQTVKLGDDDTLEVLWPPAGTMKEYAEMVKDEEEENAMSLIMRITVGGVSMLVTGDLGEEGEKELIAEAGDIKADILKAGHHGSKYSSSDEFLTAADPALAVIQVKRNNMYGHPAPETLSRLKEHGIEVKRNDLEGAVGLRLSAGEIKEIRTMK